MELCIGLNLPDPRGPLTLDTNATEAYGHEPPVQVSLPFADKQLSIIVRALDLNATPYLKREFTPAEARVLWDLGLLTDEPSATGSLTISGSQVHRKELREFVRDKLYQTLFAPLRTALAAHFAFLRGCGQSRLLHVHLEMWSDQVALFQLPWELLHGDRSLDGEIQVSRYIRYRQPVDTLARSSKLRLLVLHSEPAGLQPLGLRDEVHIQNGLRTAELKSAFEVEHIDAASIRKLGDALASRRDQPTIVHFAGHGDFGWRCEQCGALTTRVGRTSCETCHHPFPQNTPPCGFLAFTQEKSALPHWVSADELSDTFKLGKVQLAVLNACKSSLGRRGDDVFNGIAQRLMDTMPAVVATPFPLDNEGAHEFSRCFYQGLGEGESLVEALYRVRLRLRPIFPDEWFRPVLYLRSNQADGGHILQVTAAGEATETRVKEQSVSNPLTGELAAYSVNLRSQEEDFRRCIRIHRGRDENGRQHPSGKRPLVLLIPGWTDDFTSHYLLERLVCGLKDELRYYDENYKALELDRLGEPKRLACTGSEDPEMLDSVLIQSIRTTQFGSRQLPSDPRRAEDYIRNYVFTEPVILYAHLELATMKESDTALFLHRFYDFWGGWGDQNQLLLVCAFVSYLKYPCTPWERAIYFIRGHSRINASFDRRLSGLQPSASAAIGGTVLSKLERVCKPDADEWARQLKTGGALNARTHRQLQDRIDDLFSDRRAPLVKGCLPFGDLCGRLDDFLIQCQSGNTP